MNPTLDTDAIRKRFAEAIVGIREDGTMAVLVPGQYSEYDIIASQHYIDLVSGCRYSKHNLTNQFPTLIRPGDRCEVDVCGDWEMATYRGMTGDWDRPFYAQVHGDTLTLGFDKIRPLPKPVAEAKPTREQKAMELVERLARFHLTFRDCTADRSLGKLIDEAVALSLSRASK